MQNPSVFNFNALVSNNEIIYMSSREIAQITEKLHKSVLRDIRKMLDRLGETDDGTTLCPRWKNSTYTNSQNKQQPEILLNKELTVTLIAGYNPIVRNRIIQRWLELENQFGQNLMKQVPKTLPEALRLAADLSEKVAEQQKIIQQQQTELIEVKSVLNNIVASEECNTFTQAAAALGMKRQDLISILEYRIKWVYRQNGKLMPYAKSRDDGYLIYAIQQTSLNIETNKTENYWTTMITPKGMIYLSRVFGYGFKF